MKSIIVQEKTRRSLVVVDPPSILDATLPIGHYSHIHLSALSNYVAEKLKAKGERPRKIQMHN